MHFLLAIPFLRIMTWFQIVAVFCYGPSQRPFRVQLARCPPESDKESGVRPFSGNPAFSILGLSSGKNFKFSTFSIFISVNLRPEVLVKTNNSPFGFWSEIQSLQYMKPEISSFSNLKYSVFGTVRWCPVSGGESGESGNRDYLSTDICDPW